MRDYPEEFADELRDQHEQLTLLGLPVELGQLGDVLKDVAGEFFVGSDELLQLNELPHEVAAMCAIVHFIELTDRLNMPVEIAVLEFGVNLSEELVETAGVFQ